jgi:hypothetical protein
VLRLKPTLRIMLPVIVEEETMFTARPLYLSAVTAVALCLFSGPVFAQDDPPEVELGYDPARVRLTREGTLHQRTEREPDGALLEGSELEEREKGPEIKDVDPNPKMAKQVKDAQTRIKKRINDLQPNASKLLDVEEGLSAITNKLGNGEYKYLESANPKIDEYRLAHASGDKKTMKKLAKGVAKARKTYLKLLLKLEKKDFPMLAKLEAKLLKLIAEEDAENAATEDE